MQDMRKTKAQLVEELQQLRSKVERLESAAESGGGDRGEGNGEEHAALEALRESERKFRSLAEVTTAHISIIQDDRYVYANQAFLDYFELDADDLALITPEDLMLGTLTPEAIQAAMPAWQAFQESGDTRFRFEFRDMEGSWFQTNVAMMELDGKEALMSMDFDITELKRAQEALEESEKKFRALAESTSAQIMITQGDRFIYANKAALDHHGLSWEELSQRSADDVFIDEDDGDDPAACEAYAEEQLRLGGGRFRTVYSQPGPDGGERWFEAHVTRLEIDGVPAWISTAFDITELKQAQREMYRADKMAALGQIVAGVAHEINNPNNFIFFNLPILRKYVEAIAPLLELRLAEEPELKILNMPYEVFLQDVFKLLENMEHGSARITSIVSDLKNYVRNDEGQERKPGQLGQAVQRVMTLVGKQVRKMVKRLDVEIAEEGLPPVEMNAGQIEQVLINLLINAGHAADKEASWVKVSARGAAGVGAQGWVELKVEDNGAGIPEANLEQIFEPFYTSKGREQGTGLGLSISHRIIEEHGGTIDVVSTVGEGSCFTVRLPCAAK
jgi:PAS domain S-box-containing protein